MKIQEKLIKFEKYIRRTKFSYVGSKENMVWKFHELFMEEMEGTETGDKFRKKCGIESSDLHRNKKEVGE